MNPAATTSPAASTVAARASLSLFTPVPLMTFPQSGSPVVPANFTTVKSLRLGEFWVTPTATTSPAASTVTALAQSELFAAWPLRTWRQSSSPLPPANLTTVKSELVPVLWVNPAATTSPAPSTATARASSKSLWPPSPPAPSMTWRQSSRPLSPLNLTTVKSKLVDEFWVTPAATIFPLASTATARAVSEALGRVPLMRTCQADALDPATRRPPPATSATRNRFGRLNVRLVRAIITAPPVSRYDPVRPQQRECQSQDLNKGLILWGDAVRDRLRAG